MIRLDDDTGVSASGNNDKPDQSMPWYFPLMSSRYPGFKKYMKNYDSYHPDDSGEFLDVFGSCLYRKDYEGIASYVSDNFIGTERDINDYEYLVLDRFISYIFGNYADTGDIDDFGRNYADLLKCYALAVPQKSILDKNITASMYKRILESFNPKNNDGTFIRRADDQVKQIYNEKIFGDLNAPFLVASLTRYILDTPDALDDNGNISPYVIDLYNRLLPRKKVYPNELMRDMNKSIDSVMCAICEYMLVNDLDYTDIESASAREKIDRAAYVYSCAMDSMKGNKVISLPFLGEVFSKYGIAAAGGNKYYFKFNKPPKETKKKYNDSKTLGMMNSG